MDDNHFAAMTRAMGREVTRRGALARLAAGLAGAGLFAGAASLDAKRKTKGKQARSSGVAAQRAGKGKGQDKVTLCHWDEDTQTYERITVARPGADAHLRQHDEDFVFPADGECCNTSECAARECNTVSCDGGACAYALADDAVGSACGENGSGVCVRKGDGSGTCVTSNDGTNSCIGADPCGEVNGPTACAADGSCRCYSTVENAGLCLRFAPGFQYPASAISCDEGLTRAPCDDSADCPKGHVCAPLDRLGTPAGICCGRGGNDGKRGFCIDVAADLCGVPA